jgi:hypothetical protein
MDPADFYTGIVAELYEPLKAHAQDPHRYARFVRRSGLPALELGCGDGDPMLQLRRLGLPVEGVDSSADMLERCRRKAAREGLDILVHHQRMEELDLPRRYRSIFLAGPTFTLLPDDRTALAALRAIRTHLTADGTAMVPLFVPEPTPALQDPVTEARRPDGVRLRVSRLSQHRDEQARTQRTVLRYERETAGETTVADREWILHWHTQEGFRELAAEAGLDTVSVQDADGGPAGPDDPDFTFLLRPVPPAG